VCSVSARSFLVFSFGVFVGLRPSGYVKEWLRSFSGTTSEVKGTVRGFTFANRGAMLHLEVAFLSLKTWFDS